MFEMLLTQFETSLNRDRKGVDLGLLIRESCLELADTYPFLDPFAAEFAYRSGQLTLDSADDAGELAKGIIDLLAMLVEKLAARKIQFPLDEYRHAALERLQSEHAEFSKRFDLPQQLESLE